MLLYFFHESISPELSPSTSVSKRVSKAGPTMFGAKYEALKQESSELLDAETPWTRKEDSKNKRQLCWTMLVSFLLVISAILNVMAYLPTEKLQGSAPKGFSEFLPISESNN